MEHMVAMSRAPRPQAVLVNGGSASTSELVASALHDSRGASLLGQQTFGKARTQRVLQLAAASDLDAAAAAAGAGARGAGGGFDGGGSSTMLLSDTGYLTPRRARIDGKGLRPDAACDAVPTGEAVFAGGRGGGGGDALAGDACVAAALDLLAGGSSAQGKAAAVEARGEATAEAESSPTAPFLVYALRANQSGGDDQVASVATAGTLVIQVVWRRHLQALSIRSFPRPTHADLFEVNWANTVRGKPHNVCLYVSIYVLTSCAAQPPSAK
eukprot:360288-Chlamydomonas_euryale.AAC.5